MKRFLTFIGALAFAAMPLTATAFDLNSGEGCDVPAFEMQIVDRVPAFDIANIETGIDDGLSRGHTAPHAVSLTNQTHGHIFASPEVGWRFS